MIGAGHAGLAISHFLKERSIDHLVLERGEVANSWRHERWDSLRLLTPNWQSGLPGYPYAGGDPDGYMSMQEVVAHITAFAVAGSLPVRTRTTVKAVKAVNGGYQVETDAGPVACLTVVIASGAANHAQVPALRQGVPPSVTSLTAFDYRNPDSLPAGGVLVVGASATGVQLADEIQRSGRQVILAVGEHVRLPRTYRDRDVLWWMEHSGVWNQRYDEVDDIDRARRLPSPQLVGTAKRTTLDLNALRSAGVEIVGRLAGIRDGRALFSGGLANQFALADLKMTRLLDTFDEWARGSALTGKVGPVERYEPTQAPSAPRLTLDLNSGEVRAILWATGFRPDYRWLEVPVLNQKGQLRHDGGIVTGSPGMYVTGLPVLRRRKSSFIIGAQADAADLVGHLTEHLAHAS